jgi:hypothetical protein
MGRNSVKRQSKRQSKRKQNRGKRTKSWIRQRGGGPWGSHAFGVDEIDPRSRCVHELGDKETNGKEWYRRCKKCGLLSFN